MKIVVIGGTGLIGSKTVERLRRRGHEVVAASPASGVNTLTGEGLANVLAGTQVVLDLTNSPSLEDKAAMAFFETSGRNLIAAEKVAGVRHHIALSIVGAERLPLSGYLQAKMAQERIIRESGVQYTIVHSTQFFEFLDGLAKSSTVGDTVVMPSAYIQPISSDEVADALADVALSVPINGQLEIGGPEPVRMNELMTRYLAVHHDNRKVVVNDHAEFFGTELNERSLIPARNSRLGKRRFEEWFEQTRPSI